MCASESPELCPPVHCYSRSSLEGLFSSAEESHMLVLPGFLVNVRARDTTNRFRLRHAVLTNRLCSVRARFHTCNLTSTTVTSGRRLSANVTGSWCAHCQHVHDRFSYPERPSHSVASLSASGAHCVCHSTCCTLQEKYSSYTAHARASYSTIVPVLAKAKSNNSPNAGIRDRCSPSI